MQYCYSKQKAHGSLLFPEWRSTKEYIDTKEHMGLLPKLDAPAYQEWLKTSGGAAPGYDPQVDDGTTVDDKGPEKLDVKAYVDPEAQQLERISARSSSK